MRDISSSFSVVFLGVIASLIATFLNETFESSEIAKYLNYLLIGMTISLIVYYSFSTMTAYVLLFVRSKISGVWSEASLTNQIRRNFVRSNIVKIKVTRGHNLFIKPKGIFHSLIFKDDHPKKIKLQILMHFPCLRSSHIKSRAKANQIKKDQYVEGIFEVLKKFKEVTDNDERNEDIEVKFYSDDHDDWRYYIFSKPSKVNTLLFNHYETAKAGAHSSMYKVEKGPGTLCEYFEAKFDRVFEHQSVELVSNLKGSNKLVSPGFCKHPECQVSITRIYKKVFLNGEK